MNKKRPIPEVVNEKKRPIPEVVDAQPLPEVSFYSSTTSGIGLFLLIHSLWYRSLFIHPQPLA
jgi:hypothetical protein